MQAHQRRALLERNGTAAGVHADVAPRVEHGQLVVIAAAAELARGEGDTTDAAEGRNVDDAP